MITFAAAWVLVLQLTHGGPYQRMPFTTEQQCVTIGATLHKQARDRAFASGKQPPPGWICTQDEGMEAQETRT